MYRFQAIVHARSRSVVESQPAKIAGQNVQVLCVPDEAKSQPLGVTFESAQAALVRLPRMFIEGDGSFVFAGQSDSERWQVDGNLYDQGERLMYVELSGSCPPDPFDQLLTTLGWPAVPLMFQLTPHGVFVDEQEFRRLAGK